MKVKLYTQKGEENGHLNLPDSIFGVAMNKDLLHQVVRVLRVRQRKVLADTKTRSEVSGGGRKPWRQKGTGRARQGSIRAPQWRGGGVVFGPAKEKIYSARIPEKMKKNAVRVALSAKARDGEIIGLEAISIPQPKTKFVAAIFDAVMDAYAGKKNKGKKGQHNLLLIVPKKEEDIFRASRNIVSAKIVLAGQVNLSDILSKKYLIITPDSIAILEKRFS